MAAPCGCECRFHARETATDHRHRAPRGARPRVQHLPLRFETGLGIDHAGDGVAEFDAADAGLVAGDAGADRVGPTIKGLGHQVGVGDVGARQPDQISLAARHHPRRVAEVVDPAHRHDRQVGEGALELRGKIDVGQAAPARVGDLG